MTICGDDCGTASSCTMHSYCGADHYDAKKNVDSDLFIKMNTR